MAAQKRPVMASLFDIWNAEGQLPCHENRVFVSNFNRLNGTAGDRLPPRHKSRGARRGRDGIAQRAPLHKGDARYFEV